jgi:hypothetical protein
LAEVQRRRACKSTEPLLLPEEVAPAAFRNALEVDAVNDPQSILPLPVPKLN